MFLRKIKTIEYERLYMSLNKKNGVNVIFENIVKIKFLYSNPQLPVKSIQKSSECHASFSYLFVMKYRLNLRDI